MPSIPLELPIAFDVTATFVCGLTGALAAVRRKYDIVGIFALTFVTGLGGALIRDGIFLQQGPPALTRDWRYLAAIAVATLVGAILAPRLERFTRFFVLVDALGLAVYAVVGADKSLCVGLSVPACLLIGSINAVGGGVLRDVLTREEPLCFKPGQFYTVAAFLAAAVYLTLVHLTIEIEIAAGCASAVGFLLRMLSYRYNWHTTSIEWRI